MGGEKMKDLKDRLQRVEQHIRENRFSIMIIGLGSVGTYLLDYLISLREPAIHIIVVGRNFKKMEKSVNIVRIASLIRQQNESQITIVADVDLTNIDSIINVVQKWSPDFIVNSSRAYPGLKYGSISWENIRAYGIWAPLAIRFTKNIMEACDKADTDAIIINTSYSDAVIPWLRSAEKPFPDFGSGNINHLVPRIKYAVADMLGISDFWEIDIAFAAGHFHDVCISKEGQTEGVELPLKIYYKGKEKVVDHRKIYEACKILMPTDAQRNMMNASSNFAIINAILGTVRSRKEHKLFIPGAFGRLGGYPVIIGYKEECLEAWTDETIFSYDEMDRANRESMYLDGIEDIRDGILYYTDELIQKAMDAFGVKLPKYVKFDDIEKTAQFIIDQIIVPQTGGGKQ